MGNLSSPETQRRAATRVAEVAKRLGTTLIDVATALHAEIADAVPELRGDDVILELLRASTEGNVENFLHMTQHSIPVDELFPPTAAVEYARRLAQRGISSNALVRAYRIGQNRVIDLGIVEIDRQESDREVALATVQVLHRMAFAYVDRIVEKVVVEYETERERWLANRNTVRSAMLTALLQGADIEIGAAEHALGHRLRQHHLSMVIWNLDPDGSSADLRRLESLVAEIGEATGAIGHPLFLAQDHAVAWAWLPLGRAVGDGVPDAEALTTLVAHASPNFRVAVGRPHSAAAGFRLSHQEAVWAYEVASVAGAGSLPVTMFDDPGVQVSSILARDIESTRRLVASALGGLAADDDNSARLRETLLAFLQAKNSYLAAAEVVHLHKNTVKYRVDKAAEARGRSIDEDRLNLELALTACRWLGTAVLTAPAKSQPRA